MREPCRSCPEKERDLGGCRCQAFLLTGDAANTDPVCELSPEHRRVQEAVEAAARGRRSLPLLFRSDENSRQLGGMAKNAADPRVGDQAT
jgi:pyrroloquinoline quinone biosynthesis protein E